MKRYRTAIMAAVVFAGLLAWVLTQERGRAPQKGEAFGLDAKTATGLKVKSEIAQLTLQKQADQWMLLEPTKGWADKDAVEKMLKAVAELKPSGSRKGENLTDPKYGLDKPRLTVEFTYGANKTVTLQLGAQTPGGSECFAKIDNRAELYFVPASLQTDLTQQPDTLRDKALTHFDKDTVVGYTLQYPESVITVEKRGTDQEPTWFMTQPYPASADEWTAKQIAEKLAGLKADAFAPEQAPAGTDYGFAKPLLKATVRTKDNKQYVVVIGAKAAPQAPTTSPGNAPAGADKVYAQLEGRPEVLLLPSTQVSELKKTDMDMRDKRILQIDKAQVEELRVERKTGFAFTVRRLSDGWQLLNPATGRAKATKVDDMLWDLSELEAKEFLGAQKELKPYGLALPETIFTVKLRGQAEPIKIHIGFKKADGIYYAKVASSDQVYAISEMLVLDLPKTVEELKETAAEKGKSGNEMSMPPVPGPQAPPSSAPPQ